MFPPDYTDPRTPLPPPEGPPGFEFTNLVGRHRIVRGSMAPYMGWLDIMGSSANPYADEINERPRANTATVNTSDNPSVRASLLPFKNWAAIPDSNRNTSVLENPREAPVPPSSTLPSSAHSCSSSTNPLPHPSHTFPSPREDISNLSAKCLRFTPSQSTTSYSKENEVKDPTMPGDPFLESSTAERGGLTQMGSEAFAYHREGKIPLLPI